MMKLKNFYLWVIITIRKSDSQILFLLTKIYQIYLRRNCPKKFCISEKLNSNFDQFKKFNRS